MKKATTAVAVLISLILLTTLNGCVKSSTTPAISSSASEAPETKPTASAAQPSGNSPDMGKDYGAIGAQLVEDTVNVMVGGFTMDEVKKFLGLPYPNDIENINGTVRWHYKQGVEMDFVSQNDEDSHLFNYIYLDSSSSVKTDRNIGIGGSRDDVLSAYAEEINPELNEENIIVAGENNIGIIFIMENDKVSSIYIATGAYTEEARDIPSF